MDKPFDSWNSIQKTLQRRDLRLYFKEREIWLCFLGVNLGSEQDGKGREFLRPVVIIRKFDNRTFWGLPLTSTRRYGSHYFHFKFDSTRHSVVLLTQLRLFDAYRLKRKIGKIRDNDLKALKNNLKALIP